MILKILIFILFVAFFYRLYTRFIRPIVQMTTMAHQRIDVMKKKMDKMQEQPFKKDTPNKSIDGEYIDYEEVK